MSKLREAAQQVVDERDAGFRGWPLEKAIDALKDALAEPQEPVAWSPIEQPYPQGRLLDILMGDGSILCAVFPQADGDLWWRGSGTGDKFIDPKYAKVTHWRIHSDTRPAPQPQKSVVNQQMTTEPVAWMYPDDYERMITSETFCTVFSVECSNPTQGKTTVALYTHPSKFDAEPTKEGQTQTDSKQEPVAWLSPRTVDSYMRPDLGYETCSKTDYGAFPVYTHPAPQRQPLTADEARAMWPSVTLVATQDIIKFVRAVEKAHGITGETK